MKVMLLSIAIMLTVVTESRPRPMGEFIPPSALNASTDLIVAGTQSEVDLSGNYVCRDVDIFPGGKIQLPNRQLFDATMTFECRSFHIAANAVLDVRPRFGWISFNKRTSCWWGAGGTYGGRGEDAFSEVFGTANGLDFSTGRVGGWAGDCEYPRFTASGGWGGQGGGALFIKADSVNIEGNIMCDGRNGYFDEINGLAGGGGSGGGIMIIANEMSIASSARLTANGGYTSTEYNLGGTMTFDRLSGGGGRVKIFFEQGSVSDQAVIEANGFEDGSIWIQKVGSIDQLLNPTADLNGDGSVDSKDLFVMMEQWQTGIPMFTPRPTRTPIPTVTRQATWTPLPSKTPTPTVSPTPEVTVTPTPEITVTPTSSQ